jgi:hypothetical protein
LHIIIILAFFGGVGDDDTVLLEGPHEAIK